MFSPQYLATFTDAELFTLQDGCEQSAEKERNAGQFALCFWWLSLSRQVGAIIYQRALEEATNAGQGEQLSFENLPPRIAPELRP